MLKKGLLDAFWLKMIMAVLMLMDHLYYFLPGFPFWFHVVSRVVAPMFTFFIAEGMIYTRNRISYLKRLYLFGGIMLAMSVVSYFIIGSAPPNSIIMSLALTASIIYCVDKALEKKSGGSLLWILAAILFFGVCMFFEGAMLCPVMGVIFYYLRGRKLLMCAAYAAATVLMLWPLSLLFDAQVYMLLAVIPIYLYNGERGVSNSFSKYFFYVFYPAHIWILFLIQRFVYR